MFITINNCRLFFDVYGSALEVGPDFVKEKPTLLVLHGGHGMGDHTLYVEFWSQFSDIVQVVFLDQRGCGRSDHRSEPEWNLQYWADDVVQFCKTLGIKKPIIAGVSMGGHVMCEMVARYPEQMGGLIFCNTEAQFIVDDVVKKFEERGGKEIANIAHQQLTNPTPESAQAYQDQCVPFYANNAYSPAELARCIKNMPVLSYYFKNYLPNINYIPDLKKIQCPTLLMAGEISVMHPPIRAQEMAEAINPSLVTMHLFKNAGAAAYKDSPEESENVVRNFLEKFLDKR